MTAILVAIGSNAGFSPAVHAAIVGNSTGYTVIETSGAVDVGYKTVTVQTPLNLPTSPQPGMIVRAYCEDNTWTATNNILWTPAGGLQITRNGVTAATFAQTPAAFGNYGRAEFQYDGTLWRAMS